MVLVLQIGILNVTTWLVYEKQFIYHNNDNVMHVCTYVCSCVAINN